MAILPYDSLYCEEERWEDSTIEQEEEELLQAEIDKTPFASFENDLCFQDLELFTLLSKEQQQRQYVTNLKTDPFLLTSRKQALVWILKVKAAKGFKPLTAILAIDYLDRFLCSHYFRRDKPWMIQLVVVACLSLAFKVEETLVPPLLDLQGEESKYVFEAKTIQRMEILVLSSLKWRMHPVTPLSFVDYVIRSLGLWSQLHWDFLKRCECLLLSVVSDSRSMSYCPSILAISAMMHVVEQVEPFNSFHYESQILDVLNISKEEVKSCYDLIVEIRKTEEANLCKMCQKRKYERVASSPSGVIDANVFSCESSNDSSFLGSIVSSPSTDHPFKKTRV